MNKSSDSQFLKLVVNEKQKQENRKMSEWLLQSAPDPIPDDAKIILAIEGCPSGLTSKMLRELIEHAVSDGKFERILIGSRQHLTKQVRPIIVRDDDRECFRLEIALDLESEKQLLFKLVIIIELIVIGLFIRQMALDPNFISFFFH
jgi:hypothetical protein